MALESRAAARPQSPPLWRQFTWWILALPVVMLVALAVHSFYLLDYTHVLSGAMWTGADLFLGFILGPVMRRLDPPHRRAVIEYLVPKTLLYMPAVALTTGTAGWFLANWAGMLMDGNPMRLWVIAALLIIAILTVQGLGIILPNNLRIYRELHRPSPNLERIVRLNRINMTLAGIQGLMQIVIILVMARLTVS